MTVRQDMTRIPGKTAQGTLVRKDKGVFIFPGFCDVHVHFREPGFSYKETMVTGSRAAARGGYTAVCAMPNLKPVDGKGVQSESMMRSLMERCRKLGKVIAAHCEDEALVKGGYIHDGSYAAAHGHRGICSESEWGPIARDLKLAKETGCAYHVCHISCRESAELIRQAKRDGVDVTCETAPHYLLLDENDLQEDGRFRMNPPLRAKEDREALLEALLDGTIDMIATDHAPHSAEEKSRGLPGSAFGVVGLECAFPVLYTGLVKTGILPLEQLISRMAIAPRERFSIPLREDDLCEWDLEARYRIDPEEFESKGKATPFAGQTVYGRCLKTVHAGQTVYIG